MIQLEPSVMGKVRHPNVWVCTTRSGKGTYFKLAPEILEGWHIFNVASEGLSIIKDGKEFPLKGVEVVPEYFDMPTLVVTHYNVFSKTNRGRFMEIEVEKLNSDTGKMDTHTVTMRDADGAIMMMPFTSADHFVNREWDLALIDEAHRMKDKDTKWTIIIKRSKDFIRSDMTGTGFINKPDESWSLMDHMLSAKNITFDDPTREQVTDSYWDFKEAFCEISDESGYERVVGVNPDRKDEFRALIRSFGPRRTLTEVMPHIKEPIFIPQTVDLNPIQQKMYDSLKSQLAAMDQAGIPVYAANVLSMLQRLRQVCVATPKVVREYWDEQEQRMKQEIQLIEPSSKIDAVMEILDGLEWDEDRKDPVVIFSNFVDPLELLKARFDKSNVNCFEMGIPPEYPYLWMKSEHSDQERYAMWSKFDAQETPVEDLKQRIFMSTLQLGGESISLTNARHIIFLDRSWSPKDNMQGIGRVRRPGQEGQPVVININAQNTIDQYIHAVNNLKQGWFKEIFGNE